METNTQKWTKRSMEINIPDVERSTFTNALRCLNEAEIPFVVAGAFCQHFYTGFWRYTKDMDVFVLPESVEPVLSALSGAGFRSWIEADHWLGKAVLDGCTVDVIFGSGNWLSAIDRIWLDRSVPSALFGEPIRMAPIEEMIWAKSYIAGRERFDGADVCHLIVSSQGQLDWRHLIGRYGDHSELLLSYLVLYRFIYPSHRADIPDWVLSDLLDRAARLEQRADNLTKVCRGTLLDRFSYNYDVESLGYADPREQLVKERGGTKRQVLKERAWAADQIATGEAYRCRQT